MRRVVRSKTYVRQLKTLIEYGVKRFGLRVAESKLLILDDVIEHFLAAHPGAKQVDPELMLHVYPISRTPFVLIYDFDAVELRLHFIIQARADRSSLDPGDVER
ncbi:MAG: hypothetical protein WC807_03815 [Hyphomicrobium sp.]|jgi:plasmid stabilization system protein ParE